MTYLIDPTGRWWRWPSSVLAEQLGYPDPDFDLGAYAARNLGYVWVAPQDDATFLQFRAGMISMPSVDSLTPYLQKSLTAGKPVGLVFFASGWIEEAYTELAPLVERLTDLSDYNEPHIRDLFIRQPHQPRDWLRHSQHDLAGLFALWRTVGGLYSDPIETYLRRTGLVKRTVFVEPDHGDILLVKNSGAGFTVYDDFSFEYCVGRRLTDQPDKAYGRWIETTYRECLTTGNPVVDDVDAIVEQPGYDPRRRRYQRVILRWKTPDGRPLVTGSSLVTSISIPMDLNKV